MRSNYRRRSLALITLGDIHGAGGLILKDFDLIGVCLSIKVSSVLRYCSNNYDKSALELVISSDCFMSSLNSIM